MLALFVSDLHGSEARYETLFASILARRPDAVFLGGDLLPHAMVRGRADFVGDVLAAGFHSVLGAMGEAYPRVFAILGNDDPAIEEAAFLRHEAAGLWSYLHGRRARWAGLDVYGYACVPPTPFRLKDWERYDVSRFVDPGCIPPEEGWHTVPPAGSARAPSTIRDELSTLVGDRDCDRSIVLFHVPPYRTALDRAALDGKCVDHAPLDVHVGSIAVRRFIETRQPLLTLHGHVHESVRLTGVWRERIGRTWTFGAAHDGDELAVVSFDPEHPERATRELL